MKEVGEEAITPLKMHCRTCALVTSSGHLTGSNRGEEIDRSDCVIRMNDAPCAGYHLDVGRRTSLRVVAHSSLQRVLRSRQELLNGSQDTVFIFWGPSSSMRRDGRGHVYNHLRLLKQSVPRLKVYTISRAKMLKFDELFKKETGVDRKSSNSWLSTGWFTMAIALELCDRINVFGMVPPDFCRLVSKSYLNRKNTCSITHTHTPGNHSAHELHRYRDGIIDTAAGAAAPALLVILLVCMRTERLAQLSAPQKPAECEAQSPVENPDRVLH
uniref:ST6 N-acetylgalactosaminide alpha-2,6-sialyltransferase 5 n=1 Tax=Fundulus heteroclitus TaxID=8078 RepID=A0A3Q2SP97_FUNHE